MKKVLFGALLLVVLGGAGVLYVKPELAMDAVPALFTAHHKQAIQERVQALFGHLRRDEPAECVPFADPEYVRRSGTDAVKVRFQFMTAALRVSQIFGKLGDDDLRIDAIDLAPDGKAATVTASVRVGGKWGKPESYRWVRAGSQWYLQP